MRILQVCNVGNIVGGTAACAWSVTRALPEHDHHVVCRSRPTEETIKAFHPVTVQHNNSPTLIATSAELVILHNQRNEVYAHCPQLSYIHSFDRNRAPGDLQVYCSRWLASQFHAADPWILHQGVPVPDLWQEDDPPLHGPIIGRICTPIAKKWPHTETVEFYAAMARTFPFVTWHFVGCPESLKPNLLANCGNVLFANASWDARQYMSHWTAMIYHNPRLHESFGRTCTEAMLAGCFPLVDPLGGFEEQLPLHAPWWVNRPNQEAFASSLAMILNSEPDIVAEWRREMHLHAQQRFSLHAFRQRLNVAIAAASKAHEQKKMGAQKISQ